MREAVFNKKDICVVGPKTLDQILGLAASSPKKRARLCMHRGADDRVHEMIIGLVGDSYVRPHRHPRPKAESYHVIQGEIDVFFFDEAGVLTRFVQLGAPGSGKPMLYRLSARLFHMPLARSASAVYHEVYEGPFMKDADVDYAGWAPPEDDPAAAKAFVARAYADARGLPASGEDSLEDLG